jgi:hypothetical protein
VNGFVGRSKFGSDGDDVDVEAISRDVSSTTTSLWLSISVLPGSVRVEELSSVGWGLVAGKVVAARFGSGLSLGVGSV